MKMMMHSRTWEFAWKLVLLSASLIAVLLWRLPSLWERNQFYVTAVAPINAQTISPYACQLLDSCNESILRFQHKDEQIALMSNQPTWHSKDVLLLLPEARKELFSLAYGGLLLKSQKTAQAISCWQEQEPLVAQYLININTVFTAYIQERVRLLLLSIEVEPTTKGYYDLGNIYFEAGKLGNALLAYQNALDVAPSTANVEVVRLYNQLGRTYLRQGSYEQAQDSYEQALSMASWGASYIGLGQALLRQDRVDEAIVVFEGGLAIYPDSRPMSYQLAQAYFQQGNLEKAHEIISQLIALDQQYANAWRVLAKIERTRGNESLADEARSMYEQLRKQ